MRKNLDEEKRELESDLGPLRVNCTGSTVGLQQRSENRSSVSLRLVAIRNIFLLWELNFAPIARSVWAGRRTLNLNLGGLWRIRQPAGSPLPPQEGYFRYFNVLVHFELHNWNTYHNSSQACTDFAYGRRSTFEVEFKLILLNLANVLRILIRNLKKKEGRKEGIGTACSNQMRPVLRCFAATVSQGCKATG